MNTSHTSNERRKRTESAADIADRTLDKIRARMKAPGKIYGLCSWGFSELDSLTGGVPEKNVVFLGARPAAGKSALAGAMVYNVAKDIVKRGLDLYVKIYSLEMSDDAWLQRLAASLSGVPSKAMRTGFLSENQFREVEKAMAELMSLPIVFAHQKGSIHDIIEDLKDPNYPVGLWVLDHIGILGNRGENQNATANHARVADMVMDACHNIATGLVIAHMSRDSEKTADKKPTLSSFSNTDSLGKNADIALAIHRPSMYIALDEQDATIPQDAELLVLKQRDGAVGSVRMIYDPMTTTFYEDPYYEQQEKQHVPSDRPRLRAL